MWVYNGFAKQWVVCCAEQGAYTNPGLQGVRETWLISLDRSLRIRAHHIQSSEACVTFMDFLGINFPFMYHPQRLVSQTTNKQ